MKEEHENALKEMYMEKIEGYECEAGTDGEIMKELHELGYVDDKGNLTEIGIERARKIIRLHRLAERLLHDVLSASEGEVESSACKFEHFISEEVEQAICTLLGHPDVCPHGREIPPGECCIKGQEEVKSIVLRLSDLSPGEEAEIRYLSGDDEIIKKIIALGILPGKRIKVIRVFPAHLIQIDNTQIAIDEKMADCVHVMRI